MELQEALFESIASVRYVAVYSGTEAQLHQRPGIAGASAGESDKYEELFVNPAILLLAENRGRVDCGGMEFVLIRYGNFYQLVQPLGNGHLSVAIELDADLQSTIDRIRQTVNEFQT